MSVAYYVNKRTGETTTVHREAVLWLRDGDYVVCVAESGRTLEWVPYGKD
ncbi:MAG: hypothetical protein IJM76_05810 [Lachnospiraceae bacterium]|nr:hypothetical protein [Lachnospiraceae bacterium]